MTTLPRPRAYGVNGRLGEYLDNLTSEIEQAVSRGWTRAADVDHPHSLTVRGRTIYPRITIADADATPSVVTGTYFVTANTGATTITDFDNGTEGQAIFVEFGDGNTTVDFTSSGLKGNAGVDWTASQGDHMVCVYNGTDWLCLVSENVV